MKISLRTDDMGILAGQTPCQASFMHSIDAGQHPASDIVRLSTITCPACGFQKPEVMPTADWLSTIEVAGCPFRSACGLLMPVETLLGEIPVDTPRSGLQTVGCSARARRWR